jgi:hypothetical protein
MLEDDSAKCLKTDALFNWPQNKSVELNFLATFVHVYTPSRNTKVWNILATPQTLLLRPVFEYISLWTNFRQWALCDHSLKVAQYVRQSDPKMSVHKSSTSIQKLSAIHPPPPSRV